MACHNLLLEKLRQHEAKCTTGTHLAITAGESGEREVWCLD